MAKTKKVNFSIGYIEGHKASLNHIDFYVEPYHAREKDFKIKIIECLSDSDGTSLEMRVELGKVYGGLGSFMDYTMETLNEPELFLVSHNGTTGSYTYKQLHTWVFNALQELLL